VINGAAKWIMGSNHGRTLSCYNFGRTLVLLNLLVRKCLKKTMVVVVEVKIQYDNVFFLNYIPNRVQGVDKKVRIAT
jgi:hypothetical protein